MWTLETAARKLLWNNRKGQESSTVSLAKHAYQYRFHHVGVLEDWRLIAKLPAFLPLHRAFVQEIREYSGEDALEPWLR